MEVLFCQKLLKYIVSIFYLLLIDKRLRLFETLKTCTRSNFSMLKSIRHILIVCLHQKVYKL